MAIRLAAALVLVLAACTSRPEPPPPVTVPVRQGDTCTEPGAWAASPDETRPGATLVCAVGPNGGLVWSRTS